MAKYFLRPPAAKVVEAMQWQGDYAALEAFSGHSFPQVCNSPHPGAVSLRIGTLTGSTDLAPGDWLLVGELGVFHVVSDAQFQAHYVPLAVLPPLTGELPDDDATAEEAADDGK